MSIENRRIQGIDKDGVEVVANVQDDGNLTSLRVEGGQEHLLKELLVQQKITNIYLLELVGESNRVDESDIEIGG